MTMEKNNENYNEAVKAIKQAILQSQYRAAKLITGEQLSLYFGIGRYVSSNSRKGTWGTGAISRISEQLRRELPGLRGFSEQNIRNMRTFAEFWSPYLNCSPLASNLKPTNNELVNKRLQQPYGCCHLQNSSRYGRKNTQVAS